MFDKRYKIDLVADFDAAEPRPASLGISPLIWLNGLLRFQDNRHPNGSIVDDMGYYSLSGQTLGEYEVLELIGSGGMAQVYRARRKIGSGSRARIVAVKVLNPNFAAQADYANRFAREIEIAATLEHPNIVTIYDWGTQNSVNYIVMRLLDGGNIEQRLEFRKNAQNPTPSLGEVATILNALSGALDYAHSQGIYHRDLKTNNIMFDKRGVPYLVDFGIARVADSTSSLSATGFAMGTAAYMSPELWRGEHANQLTDQYALGIVIYTLVTGQRPFEGPTPLALMTRHINDQPTPSHTMRVGVPEAVTDVLNQAMAKDPQDRFETIHAFATAFERAIGEQRGAPTNFATFPLPASAKGEPTPSSARLLPQQTEKKRNWLPFAAIGGGIAVVLLIVLLVAMMGRGNSEVDVATIVAASQTALVQVLPTNTNGGIQLVDPETPTPRPTDEASATSAVSSTPVLVTLSDPEQSGGITAQTETVSAPVAPTPTPTDSPTIAVEPPTSTETATRPTSTPMPTDTATSVPSDTFTPSWTPTVTASNTLTWTPTVTDTPTPLPTNTPLPTTTPTPTFTYTFTAIPSDTPSPTPTAMATLTNCEIADVNHNGTVDVFDVRIVSAAVGSQQGDAAYDPAFDFDGDGDIDVFDLRHVASQYGETCQ